MALNSFVFSKKSVILSYRIQKLIEYFLKRGEPMWFNLDEIFTTEEIEKYNKAKEKGSVPNIG